MIEHFERLSRDPHLVEAGEIRMFGAIGPSEIVCERRIRTSLFVLSDYPVIRIRLNSGGGRLEEARLIYSLLREQNKPVHATIEKACSGAALIAMAAERIEIDADATFMIHGTSTRLDCLQEGQPRLTAAFLRQIAGTLDSDNDRLVDIFARRTGLERARLYRMLDGESYLEPDEAVRLGFCDNIVGHTKPPKLRLVA